MENLYLKTKFTVSSSAFAMFFLLMPFIKPDSFRNISLLDNCFDAWCLFNTLIIVVDTIIKYFRKAWKPSIVFKFIILLNIWLQISTFLNSGFQSTMAKNFLSVLSMTLLVDVYSQNNEDFLAGFMTAFEIIIYCNFITFILFPHGMYSVGLYTTNWLMGYDNSQIKFFLCAAVISALYLSVKRYRLRSVFMFLIVILSVLFTRVFTALIGLVIILGAVFFRKTKLYKVFNPYVYYCIACLAFVFVVLKNGLADKMDLITKITGKTSTFSTRFDIWLSTIESIKKSPVIGNGWKTTEERAIENMNPFATHAHDTYLEYLYQGGIIGFIIFMVMMFIIMRSLAKCKNKSYSFILSSMFFAFMIMMLVEAYVFPVMYMTLLLIYHCETRPGKSLEKLLLIN